MNTLPYNDDPSYIGKIYGDLLVLEAYRVPHKRKSGGTIMWVCECVHCGKVSKRVPSVTKKGVRCQCQVEAERKAKWSAEIGNRYGRLTVVGVEHKISGKNKKVYAVCNCDCGGSISTQFAALRSGQCKSCGCIQEEFIASARGDRATARSRSPLYSTWSGMKSRCLNEKAKSYPNYGGRGITICDEWLGPDGFDRFEKWSYENGYRPESGLSLDRIDVNGNYCPENCRYTTVYVQRVNQRPPRRRPIKTYTVDGETKTLNQWCSEYNISAVSVRYRMNTLGMDFETALKTPKSRKGNVFAGEQSRSRSRQRAADLNKCQSYIEANLYLAAIRHDLALTPQYPVGLYCADFLVTGSNVLVECDGLDYHKTKDQVNSDYSRERYFMKQGYIVVRFSGSEINADPGRCCKELLEVLEAHDEHRKTNNGQEGADRKTAS